VTLSDILYKKCAEVDPMKKIFDVIISILIVLALGAVSGVAARGAGSLYESIDYYPSI